MKKLLVLSVALMAAQAAAASSPANVTFWYEGANPTQAQALQKDYVDPFNASQKACRLSVDVRGSALTTQLRAALLSGGGPDIVLTPGPSYVASMAEAGQVLDLSAYAAKYNWAGKILPAAYNSGKLNGKLYSLPKTYETVNLYYNKSLFDQNGWRAPKTLKELDTLAASMLAKGIVPFGGGNADWRGANEWLVTAAFNHYAGPEKVGQAMQGKIPWTDPAFVGAVELLKNWWDKGYFGKNYLSLTLQQGFEQVATGKAGMSINGTWAFVWIGAFDTAKSVAATASIPALAPGVPYPLYALGIGTTLSINKNSKAQDCTAAALNYIYTSSVYQNINRDWRGDWNIPLKSINATMLAKNTTALYAGAITDLARTVNKGNFGYTTWTFLPPKTDTYLINGIEQVWLSGLSPKAYLEQLNTIFQGELKEGNLPPIPTSER